MLTKLFDTLANMGVWIRFHDKRTEGPTEDGRIWGPLVEGFAISIAAVDEDRVSVLIKNNSDREVRAAIPGWLHYLHVTLTGPNNSTVGLKPYGKQILESAQTSGATERVFPPRGHLTTEIPIGALYDLSAKGPYAVKVECHVPGNSAANLTSNAITLRANQ